MDAIPIQTITVRPSRFPSSFTRTPMGIPYGLLSPRGRIRAYRVPVGRPDRLGSLSTPEALGAHDMGKHSPCARFGAFWLKPVNAFGLFFITTLARVHIC